MMPRRGPRAATRSALPAVLAAGVLAAGCVSDGPPTRSARIREPVRQPANLGADSIVLAVSQFPEDTDANGYADTILASVHLFTADPRYPLPVTPVGAMRFFIVDAAGRSIAEWRFDAAQTAARRHASGVGVGYVFQLDLAEAGAEQVDPVDATLRCEFSPESGGQPIRSRGGVTVALGPVR